MELRSDIVDKRFRKLLSQVSADIDIELAFRAVYFAANDEVLDDMIKILNSFMGRGLSPNVALPIVMSRPIPTSESVRNANDHGPLSSHTGELTSSNSSSVRTTIVRAIDGNGEVFRREILGENQGGAYKKRKKPMKEILENAENGIVSKSNYDGVPNQRKRSINEISENVESGTVSAGTKKSR